MNRVKQLEQFEAWKKAEALSFHAYELSKTFPPEEFFGFTMRIRQAASAISSYIAEGFYSPVTDYVHSVEVAVTYVCELKETVKLSCFAKYVTREEVVLLEKRCDEMTRLLNRLIFTLKYK